MRTTLRIAMFLGVAALLTVDLAGQGGGAGAQKTPAETLSQTFRGSRARDVEYQKIPPFKISTSFTARG